MKVLASLVALLFATPAFAQSSACWPLDIFVESMSDRGATVRPVRGNAAAEAVSLYNRTPPASTLTFDLVLAVERPDGSAALFYGNAGMVCVHLSIEAPAWRQLRERFVGRPA